MFSEAMKEPINICSFAVKSVIFKNIPLKQNNGRI